MGRETTTKKGVGTWKRARRHVLCGMLSLDFVLGEAASAGILSRKEMWLDLHFRKITVAAEWSIDETERWEVGIPAAPVLHRLGRSGLERMLERLHRGGAV